MKKYIALLIAAGLFASCQDFLKEKQVSVYTPDQYDTEDGLDLLVTGSYKILRNKFDYADNNHSIWLSTGEIEENSDLSMSSYSGSSVNPGNIAWNGSTLADGTNTLIGTDDKDSPYGAYPSINRCNLALEKMAGKAPGKYGTDNAYLGKRRGEILFLRSYSYYQLVTQLGDVPFILKATGAAPTIFNDKRAPAAQIWSRLIADMRIASEGLPVKADERGRITKDVAEHFLAKLYLMREQGKPFKDNAKKHLAMLYKGENTVAGSELDSAIYYATRVIERNSGNSANGGLADDFWDLFYIAKGDLSAEENPEILLGAMFNATSNGRYGQRYNGIFTCKYVDNALFNMQNSWEYGAGSPYVKTTDFGYDVFTNKVADSRFEKSFEIDYISNYQDAKDQNKNTAIKWNQVMADRFNGTVKGLFPDLYGSVTAAVENPKFKRGERAIGFIENTYDQANAVGAMTLEDYTALPFIALPRWAKGADGKMYYRKSTYEFGAGGVATDMGLDVGNRSLVASSRKIIDPNRSAVATTTGAMRDCYIFRLAETYLIRAEAYGRRDGAASANAINDINVLRRRAAYKAGEKRNEMIARFYPESASLTAPEKIKQADGTYRAADQATVMLVDGNEWAVSGAKADVERYVKEANTTEKRFIHFIYNEYGREFNAEGNHWEVLKNAGILYERMQGHAQLASSDRTADVFGPPAANSTSSAGQNGLGKGDYKEEYIHRPFPQVYLELLTDDSGKPLDAAGKTAFQNPGYN